MQRIRSEIMWLALLVAFTLVFFRRVVLGEVLWFGDFQAVFEPLRFVLGRAWRHGLPLWNRWLASGHPLLANPIAGALYPPNLLFALPFGPPARILTLLVVAHIVWGGLGAGLLARRFGLTPAGALVAALVFGFSGPVLQTTYTVILTTTAAWIPWVVLSFLALRDAPPGGHVRPALGFAGAFAAMLLSSEPFTILSVVLGCAALWVRKSTVGMLRTLGRAAVGVGLALFIVSPQLLATFRTLPATVRAVPLSVERATEWSMLPLDALGFLLPDLFGEDLRVGPHAALASVLTNRNAMLLDGLYIGPLALALAFAGLFRRFPARGALTAWLVLLFLLALGRSGLFYPLLLHVPAFAVFRYPYKWLVGAMLPLAVLAGAGAVPDGDDDVRAFRHRSLAVGAVLLVALGLVSWWAGAGLDRAVTRLVASPGVEPSLIHAAVGERIREVALQAALPLAAALFALVATPARLRRFLPGTLAALVAADLFFGNRSVAPSVDARFFTTVPEAVIAIRNDRSGHGRVWVDARASTRAIPSRVPPGVPLNADVLRPRRERLDAYTGASYGLELAFNGDVEAFSTRRYSTLRGLIEASPPREMAMLLAAAGVTHAVTLAPLEDPLFRELARVDVGAERPLSVLRVALPASRVRVVRALVPYRSTRDITEALRRSPEDLLLRTAFIAEDDLPRLRALPPPKGEGRSVFPGTPHVGIVRETNREVEVESFGPGGFLVLADTLAPGWTANIDGAAVPIFAADIAFRLVSVPPGRHTVVFRYDIWD